MAELKVGDRVRILDEKYSKLYELPEHPTGTIIRLCTFQELSKYMPPLAVVEADSECSTFVYIFEGSFELIDNATPAHLPVSDDLRKKTPLWSGLVKYFPDALVAVAQLSQAANEKHNPGEPLHWAREKSPDHKDTLLRHLFDSGTTDTDGIKHSTKVAWRALAMLQVELEKERNENGRS